MQYIQPQIVGFPPPDPRILQHRQERKNFSRILLGLVFYLLVSSFVQAAFTYVCAFRFPKFYDSELFLWISYIVPPYVVAFPLVWWMLSAIPKKAPQKKTLSKQNKVIFLAASFGFLYVGQLIAHYTTELLSLLKGNSLHSVLDQMVFTMSPLMMLVVIVILGPICEELLFRKLVIDRLLPYGERMAVLISGLIFGLIHGNFFQFFYSFFVGAILGYVYVKTGKIRYTIGMHMIINFTGSLVPDSFDRMIHSEDALSSSINPWGVVSDIYTIAQLILVVVGIILFTMNIKKISLKKEGDKALPYKTQMKLLFGNTGMILFLVLTGISFIGSIFI